MPAAAVIPAPIAYIKVAAVKKLVVGFQSLSVGPASVSSVSALLMRLPYKCFCASSLRRNESCIFYFEQIRVFQAGFLL